MKDYIIKYYPEIHRSYLKLSAVVAEAWNITAHGYILDLIKSMPDRCKTIIKAEC
jgi:hypothetical protein